MNKYRQTFWKYWKFFLKHKIQIFFILLLSSYILLRFYKLEQLLSLGWDQVDSASAAKDIILYHPFRLEGVPVKANTGLFMGPLYYYLITPFYFFTNLDPIASAIFQAFVDIASALILFYVTKKLFNANVALVALFINTFSFAIMLFDRTQNAISLIVPVSYLIFYFLYKVITGKPKYLLPLSITLGFSFHVDFTSVFYPLIILFALPFFPKTKKTLYYLGIAFPIFLLFIAPLFLNKLQTHNDTPGNFAKLFNTSFHGFHLTRVLQLTHDAFIQFMKIFEYKLLDYFDFLIPPFFAFIFYRNASKEEKKKTLLFSYLLLLWIVIPWFVLATYSGELTDSYFSLPRDIFIAIVAYFTVLLYSRKILAIKVLLVALWGIYAVTNTYKFLGIPDGNYLDTKREVQNAINHNQYIKYEEHDPTTYMFDAFRHK